MLLRDARPSDEPALIDALMRAANWDGQVRFTREELLAEPHLWRYVAGWPRPGDFGTIAMEAAAEVGAVWCRTFDSAVPGYGYVADDVPELSIGVAPDHRGRGIGTALLGGGDRQGRCAWASCSQSER